MQNRVFDPADILVHIHPVFGVLHVGGRGRARRGEAGKVPRRIDKRIHRIGFAQRFGPAGRALGVTPGGVAVQRIARTVKRDIVGQLHRQVLFLLRHDPATVAVDHRNRAAPIALAAQAPVAQAVFDLAGAQFALFEPVDCLVDAVLAGGFAKACEMVDIHNLFGLGGHQRFSGDLGCVAGHVEGRNHAQIIFACEIKVALVMGWAGIDRAGAVIHQHEVPNPHRQLLIGPDGVAHGNARVDALLLGLFHGGFGGVHLAGFFDERRKLGIGFGQRARDRMLGRNR